MQSTCWQETRSIALPAVQLLIVVSRSLKGQTLFCPICLIQLVSLKPWSALRFIHLAVIYSSPLVPKFAVLVMSVSSTSKALVLAPAFRVSSSVFIPLVEISVYVLYAFYCRSVCSGCSVRGLKRDYQNTFCDQMTLRIPTAVFWKTYFTIWVFQVIIISLVLKKPHDLKGNLSLWEGHLFFSIITGELWVWQKIQVYLPKRLMATACLPKTETLPELCLLTWGMKVCMPLYALNVSPDLLKILCTCLARSSLVTPLIADNPAAPSRLTRTAVRLGFLLLLLLSHSSLNCLLC